MTTEIKAIWNNTEVSILGIEHKSSFGDLVRIRYNNKEKVVNSNYIKKIKEEEKSRNE